MVMKKFRAYLKSGTNPNVTMHSSRTSSEVLKKNIKQIHKEYLKVEVSSITCQTEQSVINKLFQKYKG